MLDLLPREGLYCVAIPNSKGGFNHRWASSVEEAATIIKANDDAGNTVYIAQASFTTVESRKGTNACKVRSFWLDIDCGEGKPYADQREGAAALKVFCDETGLPLPSVVNSGNGLYAHWILTDDILPDQWKATAAILKKVTHAYNFRADDSRTSDVSSVLRPVGATHRKSTPKPVVAVCVKPEIEFTHFASLLQRAADAKQIDTHVLSPPPAYAGLNDEFISGIEGPPMSGVEAAKHCAQLARMRDTLGDISEPEWYACIGVLRHCTEGEALIQEWSSGHPGYEPDQTRNKIAQHKMPPTTCQHFGSINPTGCVGCRHNGKIKTPIVLGRPRVVVKEKEVAIDRVEMPCGFSLTADGIFCDAEELRIFPYDIYPTLVAKDDSLGYDTVTFRHRTPNDGWMEFSLRTGIMNDKKAFMTALNDNHVQPTGAEEKKLMVAYLEQYTAKLRAQRNLTRLYAQMGWKFEPAGAEFILGTKRYRAGVPCDEIGFAKNVPEVARSFRSQGDLDAWRAGTACFGAPGMEGHLFAFYAGAWAAPLLTFTGYEGAMVSMIGDSGTGKTLIARLIQSVYGEPSRLMMLRDDTKNSLVARLGVYGSLPVTIDEVTNIDANDLSELVYRVTQGRDKARLSRNGTERPMINHWNTIAVVSSNASMIEKLGALKSDASAEINRIVEFYVHPNEALNRETATAVYRAINANFGLAGPLYVQYLVDHAEEHRDQIDKISDMLVQQANCSVAERFWVVVCASVLYGAIIASRLGLITHDVKKLTPWVINLLRAMRSTKHEMVQDPISIIGMFFSTHAQHGVVVGNDHATAAMREIRGAVLYRYEESTGKCYVSRDALRAELAKSHTDITKLRADLKQLGVLLHTERRKTLTAGIVGYPGAQQMCWEIDMKHPALGNVVARLVSAPTPHPKLMGVA